MNARFTTYKIESNRRALMSNVHRLCSTKPHLKKIKNSYDWLMFSAPKTTKKFIYKSIILYYRKCDVHMWNYFILPLPVSLLHAYVLSAALCVLKIQIPISNWFKIQYECHQEKAAATTTNPTWSQSNVNNMRSSTKTQYAICYTKHKENNEMKKEK